MMYTVRFFLLFLVAFSASAQYDSKLLDSIISAHPFLRSVAENKKTYQVQIIYTQINRDAANRPSFINHTYSLDSLNYFYCASLVKLPCAIFALEKINGLKLAGLSRNSPMLTDSAGPCQHRTWTDTTSENGYPSVEHHIKKMLLVSDNASYSRIYEFLNPKYINARLAEMGHPTARIVHRLDAACSGIGNDYVNPVRFLDAAGREVYSQRADTIKEPFPPAFKELIIGRDIYNKRKRLVSSRKDFTKSNYLSLQMVHTILRDLVFMDNVPEKNPFKITPSDRDFLLRHLGMYPRESQFPKYPKELYFDAFKKYFIYGNGQEPISGDSVRIFNIVGRAYGYMIDCAYIVNYRTKTEFMLSAVIYNNARNSFGTGVYEYYKIGLPFFKELSLALYALESRRKKAFLPNLDPVNFYRTQ